MNLAPKPIVINIITLKKYFLLNKIKWWAQVAVIPDLNKITVFNKGKWKGFKGFSSKGGQTHPIWISGLSLWWKKAQKKPKKNITSEKINHLIPNFKPPITLIEWDPSSLPSFLTSNHQKNINTIIENIDKRKKNLYFVPHLNILTILIVKLKALTPAIKGQGLIETIW